MKVQKDKKGVVMAIEAVKNFSVGIQQTSKANLKSQQSFTSNPEVDEEKSNATKYMLGATALAAVIGLGVLGYKGKLGKGIQEFLGGAGKAPETVTGKAEEAATDALTSGVTGKDTKKATEAIANNTADVVPVANASVSEEIGKLNEFFKKFGVDGKAFIDNNNPEQVVIISKYKDGYYKQVQSAKDFKFNGQTPNSDKNISSVVIDKKGPRHTVKKVAANGVETEIVRNNGKVRTKIQTPEGHLFYRVSNGNKIESETIMYLGKYEITQENPNFEEVKNSFFAIKLKEGLN